LGVSQLATGGAPILNGRRQPSFGGTSRMTRECHVRIWQTPASQRPHRCLGCHCLDAGLEGHSLLVNGGDHRSHGHTDIDQLQLRTDLERLRREGQTTAVEYGLAQFAQRDGWTDRTPAREWTQKPGICRIQRGSRNPSFPTVRGRSAGASLTSPIRAFLDT
jgi:hypothetical protein